MACPCRKIKTYARFKASLLSSSHATGRSRIIMPAIGGWLFLLSSITPHPPPPPPPPQSTPPPPDDADVVALATLEDAELPFALYALTL
ncbi:MAG: hypothetical protein HZC10_05855 [Nitrospirae bacterium]|nr:hypothetical protein [Nitrospirota bacterium]